MGRYGLNFQAGFEKDKPVVIIRLQTATHLNGRRGTIVSFEGNIAADLRVRVYENETVNWQT